MIDEKEIKFRMSFIDLVMNNTYENRQGKQTMKRPISKFSDEHYTTHAYAREFIIDYLAYNCSQSVSDEYRQAWVDNHWHMHGKSIEEWHEIFNEEYPLQEEDFYTGKISISDIKCMDKYGWACL